MEGYILCFFKSRGNYCLTTSPLNESIESLYKENIYNLKTYEDYLDETSNHYFLLFIVLLLLLLVIKKMNYKYEINLYIN